MTKISKFLIGAAFSALVLPSAAMADVSGSSSGNFSNLSNGCTHSDNCDLVSSNTKLEWGSDNSRRDLSDPSTLTADTLGIAVSGTQANVKIAELSWYNSSTNSDQTPDFSFRYNLTVTFVGGTGDAQSFNLAIDNTSNPMGDILSGFSSSDLAALSFVLPGWSVTNFHYAIDDAGGPGSPVFGGACGTGNWCNPESGTSDLFIEADFTKLPTSVPEPMSLALFGAGLAGAAAMRLRRRNKA